jgi:hypothetical protein
LKLPRHDFWLSSRPLKIGHGTTLDSKPATSVQAGRSGYATASNFIKPIFLAFFHPFVALKRFIQVS